jgi:hypothetical protein
MPWSPQRSSPVLVRLARRPYAVWADHVSARAFKPPSLGGVGYKNKTDEQGQQLIWLDRAVVDRLRAMRGPGETYSDVILRLATDAGSP